MMACRKNAKKEKVKRNRMAARMFASKKVRWGIERSEALLHEDPEPLCSSPSLQKIVRNNDDADKEDLTNYVSPYLVRSRFRLGGEVLTPPV